MSKYDLTLSVKGQFDETQLMEAAIRTLDALLLDLKTIDPDAALLSVALQEVQ